MFAGLFGRPATFSYRDLNKKRRSISRVLSWTIIHLGQMSPSASSNLPRNSAGRTLCSSIWSCSRWGLPCHFCCQKRGALLPHPFTLTDLPKQTGGILSVALAVGSRLPGVTWHLTLWSPDFPRPSYCRGAIVLVISGLLFYMTDFIYAVISAQTDNCYFCSQ